MLNHEDFEHLDPGQAYYSIDYEVGLRHAAPAVLLQAEHVRRRRPRTWPPARREISADGKTITVHIRKGVHFSPPVNREVTSADVAYAIERGANPNVANPTSQPTSARSKAASKANGGPIPGITTPNSTRSSST